MEQEINKIDEAFSTDNANTTKSASTVKRGRRVKTIPVKQMTLNQIAEALKEGRITLKKCTPEQRNTPIVANAAILYDIQHLSKGCKNLKVLQKNFDLGQVLNYVARIFEEHIVTLLPKELQIFSMSEHEQFKTLLGQSLTNAKKIINDEKDNFNLKNLVKNLLTSQQEIQGIIATYQNLTGKKDHSYKDLPKEYSEDPCFIAKAVKLGDTTYQYCSLKSSIQDLVLQLEPSYYNLLPTHLFNAECEKLQISCINSIKKGLARYAAEDKDVDQLDDNRIKDAIALITMKREREWNNINKAKESEAVKAQKRKVYLDNINNSFASIDASDASTELENK